MQKGESPVTPRLYTRFFEAGFYFAQIQGVTLFCLLLSTASGAAAKPGGLFFSGNSFDLT